MVLDLLLIAVVISLEPIPLTAFILVLASKRGVRKGAAFLFGWLISLAAVIAITVLLTGNKPPAPSTAPSLAALAVKLAIGVALVFVGLRQRAKMGKPKKPKKVPKWQAGIDNMSLWFAFALGPLSQPWGLVGAGVATIVAAKLSSWESYIALFMFCVVSSSTYLAMEIYAAVKPENTQAFLTRIRTWIDTHTDQVIVFGSIGLGFWLVGKSIFSLVTS